MEHRFDETLRLLSQDTQFPERVRLLRRVDTLSQIAGLGATVLHYGHESSGIDLATGVVVVCAMSAITLGISIRYHWSLVKPSFVRRNRAAVTAAGLWLAGLLIASLAGPLLSSSAWPISSRWEAVVLVSELVILGYAVFGFVRGVREVAAEGINPALVLAGSFGVLIAIGTALLMLPRCTAEGVVAPWEVALFTATSASCVTGLVVVDTGSYWSRTGQCVILGLFQLGGLGIMTFGALFAVIAGRGAGLREAATVRELLDAEGQQTLRRLILAIVGFTLLSELIGAWLISGLWADLPLGERIFQSVFHAVSGFCNAGFATTENSFVGAGTRWQIWGVLSLLIIIGGLGFGVLNNLMTAIGQMLIRLSRRQIVRVPVAKGRLNLTCRIAILTSAALLVASTVLLWLLERHGAREHTPWLTQLADAWFQAVTLRTAGFQTVEIGELHPATKLVAISMMFIGASPGSTGGGIKTTVFAVALLGLFSILRGRQQVECFGRTIAPELVNRALAVIVLGALTVMTGTLLVSLFENRPSLFLDHLFEVTSAAGTVGLSSSYEDGGERISITMSLSSASRRVLILVMFLGRIGPLTLLVALTGRQSSGRYEYPPERVVLG